MEAPFQAAPVMDTTDSAHTVVEGTEPFSISRLLDMWQIKDADGHGGYRDRFLDFLNTYTFDDPLVPRAPGEENIPYYHAVALNGLRNSHLNFEVDLQHLQQWDLNQEAYSGVTLFVLRNALHLMEDRHIQEVATLLVRKSLEHLNEEDRPSYEEFFRENRELFNLALVNWTPDVRTLRDLRPHEASELVTITGTVTRTSGVRPELRSACFSCDLCSSVNGPVIQEFKYTEPGLCHAPLCNNRRHWTRIEGRSLHDDWQKLRIQENANEIPSGCMPRSADVILRGHLTNQCKAGDMLHMTGCLAIVPEVVSVMARGDVPKLVMREHASASNNEMNPNSGVGGFKGLGVRDLGCKSVFIVTGLKVTNVSSRQETLEDTMRDDIEEIGMPARGTDSSLFKSLGASWQRLFKEVSNNPRCLDVLARHFLSHVHGHAHVKKGLLMMLAGGVEKHGEKDAMKLRGDINLNIVGDPGTAKSLILREVNRFVPRSVYASGKMATAAGLTASVSRDRETPGIPVIEAGALMLADGGICCIDEFDKMDQKDMSAIHEAMEQQTISITKAGVQATLNARASILAACNPLYGKYDATKSFRQNVNLTAPILSRFDLLFVLTDDRSHDDDLARHIVGLDDVNALDDLDADSHMSETALKKYLAVARTLKPRLSKQASDHLVKCYVVLRQQDAIPGAQRHVRITVRQLESLVRLSEACAKLHLSDEVLQEHVESAFDLFQSSLTRITKGTITFGEDYDLPNATENAEGSQTQSGKNPSTSSSMDESRYIACGHAVVLHFLEEQEKRTLAGEVGTFEVLEDALIDWLILKQFPERDDDDLLIEDYHLAGKIIRRMIEVDQTLVASTMQTAGTEEPERFISVHPSVDAREYLGEARGDKADRIRRKARGGFLPIQEDLTGTPTDENVERESVPGEENLFMGGDRFEDYLQRMMGAAEPSFEANSDISSVAAPSEATSNRYQMM